MFRSLKDLKHYTVGATDGHIGAVKDIYFDDRAWAVRYLVVETGNWFNSRKVLITPIALHNAPWAENLLPVSITREQVRNSPSIDVDKPVSRQHEIAYYGYYGYPYYWGGTGLWGDGLDPFALLPGSEGYGSEMAARAEADAAYAKAEARIHSHDDPHLRSADAVIGYHLAAADGEIGHVADILVDDQTWSVRYLVVDTANWFGGRRVLIAPQWVTDINWATQRAHTDLTRDSVKEAPAFESTEALNRAGETSLYQHYGRAGYWPAVQP